MRWKPAVNSQQKQHRLWLKLLNMQAVLSLL